VITSIEKNNKQVNEGVKGDTICLCITQDDNKQQYTFGRQFTEQDVLYSTLTRESIDALKTLYPDIVSQKEIFNLVKKLKNEFDII